MKYYFLLIFSIAIISCNAQQKITAKKNRSGDLVGYANKESFNEAPYNTWFTQKFNAYTPDKTTISLLKPLLKTVKIKGFIGTWCGDSRRETPQFFKILDLVGFNLNNFTLITLNRSKKTPDNLQSGLDIKRVPTFIFYRNGKEIGRYVEYARESLEKDILKIISGKKYKHAYDRSK